MQIPLTLDTSLYECTFNPLSCYDLVTILLRHRLISKMVTTSTLRLHELYTTCNMMTIEI